MSEKQEVHGTGTSPSTSHDEGHLEPPALELRKDESSTVVSHPSVPSGPSGTVGTPSQQESPASAIQSLKEKGNASSAPPTRNSSLKHSARDDTSSHKTLPDMLSAIEPSLSHLASGPSLRSHVSQRAQRHRLLTPISEQRHPGKEGARISSYTKLWEPNLADEDEMSHTPSHSPDDAVAAAAAAANGGDSAASKNPDGFLTGFPLGLLILGLCLVVFLISVDRTIITTVGGFWPLLGLC